MRPFVYLCVVMLMGAALVACGGEQAAVEEAVEQPDPEPTVESAKTAEPEPEPIALPEGFPETVPVLAELNITSVETLDAGKRMFKVAGETSLSVDDVLAHYEKTFPDSGWAVDSTTAWREMTVISANKDGVWVIVQSDKVVSNTEVSISTGNLQP